jgi:hypothetical protein
MEINLTVTKMGLALALLNYQPLRAINGKMVMEYVFEMGVEPKKQTFWVEGSLPDSNTRARVIVTTID